MRKIAVSFILLTLLAAGVLAQNPPTLRIVTEDPTLPSELFYGDIKVKPLRLRPGTNPPVRITIDDSDFFVQQHYVDFLSRFPEQSGFNAWMNVLNACAVGDAACLHEARITTSAAFFGSQEFQLKGYYVFRFYRASLNRLPDYPEMVADMRAVTGATADEVNQKRTAFATNWVLRTDFLASFPRDMAAAAFVDGISLRAGITVANHDQIVAALNANNTDLGRSVALRAIVESPEEFNKEYNSAFVFIEYVGYLRRAPEPQGYSAWLTYLNAHPTDSRTMVWGFMDSIEYRNRF
jgi:hypothetical protein